MRHTTSGRAFLLPLMAGTAFARAARETAAAPGKPCGWKGNLMSKRLFVGNLSFDISEEELRNAFAAWGATGATIPMNQSGRPKGFGYVDVAAEQAQEAIAAMQGKDLGGRELDIKEAKPKPELNTWGSRPPGGYGGRGRGGYGGGGGRRW
jgi:cold-inducible RNA-binding protein